MAKTKKQRFRAQGAAAAKRAAVEAQRIADELNAVAVRAEEREAAREKGTEARLDAVDELYDLLGIEPEPKREQMRMRGGEPQTMLVERDPKELARTTALLSLVEKLVESAGPSGLAHYRAEVERERQSARADDDAARDARIAKKRAIADAERVQTLGSAPEQAVSGPLRRELLAQ